MRPAEDGVEGTEWSGDAADPAAHRVARAVRAYGTVVAAQELRTASARLDGLSAGQRSAVAAMADRIVAGVLAPPRRTLDGAGDGPAADPAVVADLFALAGDDPVARPATDNH